MDMSGYSIGLNSQFLKGVTFYLLVPSFQETFRYRDRSATVYLINNLFLIMTDLYHWFLRVYDLEYRILGLKALVIPRDAYQKVLTGSRI